MTLFNWIVFAGFLVLGAVWTIYLSHKADTSESYFVSDKNTPLFALIATLVMTELNTSTWVASSVTYTSMGMNRLGIGRSMSHHYILVSES